MTRDPAPAAAASNDSQGSRAGHAAALIAANENRDDRKAVADPLATPLLALTRGLPADDPLAAHARSVGVRFDAAAFHTRRTSQQVWAVLTRLEDLFSDIRRLEPQFAFAQLRGEARIAAGNEYRTALADPGYLARLNAALQGDAPDGGRSIAVRRMDVRILRAGPFGGETADLTAATLANHRLAGLTSFWTVVHGEDDEGLKVSVESAELFRWNWAPERRADLHGSSLPDEARILNWPWFFERLAAAIDAAPVAGARTGRALAGPWREVSAVTFVREALVNHATLRDLAARFDGEGAGPVVGPLQFY